MCFTSQKCYCRGNIWNHGLRQICCRPPCLTVRFSRASRSPPWCRCGLDGLPPWSALASWRCRDLEPALAPLWLCRSPATSARHWAGPPSFTSVVRKGNPNTITFHSRPVHLTTFFSLTFHHISNKSLSLSLRWFRLSVVGVLVCVRVRWPSHQPANQQRGERLHHKLHRITGEHVFIFLWNATQVSGPTLVVSMFSPCDCSLGNRPWLVGACAAHAAVGPSVVHHHHPDVL